MPVMGRCAATCSVALRALAAAGTAANISTLALDTTGGEGVAGASGRRRGGRRGAGVPPQSGSRITGSGRSSCSSERRGEGRKEGRKEAHLRWSLSLGRVEAARGVQRGGGRRRQRAPSAAAPPPLHRRGMTRQRADARDIPPPRPHIPAAHWAWLQNAEDTCGL